MVATTGEHNATDKETRSPQEQRFVLMGQYTPFLPTAVWMTSVAQQRQGMPTGGLQADEPAEGHLGGIRTHQADAPDELGLPAGDGGTVGPSEGSFFGIRWIAEALIGVSDWSCALARSRSTMRS